MGRPPFRIEKPPSPLIPIVTKVAIKRGLIYFRIVPSPAPPRYRYNLLYVVFPLPQGFPTLTCIRGTDFELTRCGPSRQSKTSTREQGLGQISRFRNSDAKPAFSSSIGHPRYRTADLGDLDTVPAPQLGHAVQASDDKAYSSSREQ